MDFNFNNVFNNAAPQMDAVELTGWLNRVMRSVYLKMTLGLVISALTAFLAASSEAVTSIFFSSRLSMFVLLGLEVLLVFAISGAVRKYHPAVATALFLLFAVVNGLALFPIFYVYTAVSIYKTFFITAGVFGAMSVYGYFTDRDLSGWGSFLFMALIGLIIVAVVNIFLASTALDWIISGVGVLIFIGLTAWDTQKIKQMALMSPNDSLGKIATYGALQLYLDFVNLFIYLLRFFGNRD